MCHDKKKRRQQYLLTRPQKTITFCDKTVFSTLKYYYFLKVYALSMQQKYRNPWEKNLLYEFYAK